MAGKEKKNIKKEVEADDSNIIPMYADTAMIDQRIKDHLASIRSLVARLRPSERQLYVNGLFAHLLSHQFESIPKAEGYPSIDSDYESLSAKDLGLIRELSGHLQQLYTVTSGH